jgi:hypothetical protein
MKALEWTESLAIRSLDDLVEESDAFIEGFEPVQWWVFASENEAFPWSEDLIERYADHWNWGSYQGRDGRGGLSANEAFPGVSISLTAIP